MLVAKLRPADAGVVVDAAAGVFAPNPKLGAEAVVVAAAGVVTGAPPNPNDGVVVAVGVLAVAPPRNDGTLEGTVVGAPKLGMETGAGVEAELVEVEPKPKLGVEVNVGALEGFSSFFAFVPTLNPPPPANEKPVSVVLDAGAVVLAAGLSTDPNANGTMAAEVVEVRPLPNAEVEEVEDGAANPNDGVMVLADGADASAAADEEVVEEDEAAEVEAAVDPNEVEKDAGAVVREEVVDGVENAANGFGMASVVVVVDAAVDAPNAPNEANGLLGSAGMTIGSAFFAGEESSPPSASSAFSPPAQYE